MIKSLKKFPKRFIRDKVFRFAFLNLFAAGFFAKDILIHLFSIDLLLHDTNFILSNITKFVFWLLGAQLTGWVFQAKKYILDSAKSKKNSNFNKFMNGKKYWILLVLTIIFTSFFTYCISRLFISNFPRI